MDEHLEHNPTEADEDDPGWPIGFLIFVGLGALYLIVRFVEMGARFIEWAF